LQKDAELAQNPHYGQFVSGKYCDI